MTGRNSYMDDRYEPVLQDRSYPFGKYPKTKYEAVIGKGDKTANIIYSFVTTIYTEGEAVKILLEKIRIAVEIKDWVSFRSEVKLYKNTGSGRVLIYTVKPIEFL